jgi:hypothetical protein
MCFGAHKNNSPTQFWVLRQRYTGAKAEKEFPQSPMGIDPKERFTKGDKAGKVQDRVRRELMKLHAVNKKKPTEEFMGRKREFMQEESKKRHPIAIRGLGDVFGAGEDDLVPFGDEPLLLGLGVIALPKLRGHPAGRRIGDLLFPHLVLVGKAFYTHLQQL